VQKQDDSVIPKNVLNIATLGSKGRVCLTPHTISHLHLSPGSKLVFLLKTTKKDKKPYVCLLGVKPDHFEVEEKNAESIKTILLNE